MRIPNLYRRGHLFWWRRKIKVGGVSIAIALPLRTANLYQARAMAEQLGTALENQRMAYSQQGMVVDRATLQKIMNDAMRHQLDRIEQDQRSGRASEFAHASSNFVYAEIWSFFARNGAHACWSEADEHRLLSLGWPPENVALVTNEMSRLGRHLISRTQLEHYAATHAYPATEVNDRAVKQAIFEGRAAACHAATTRLAIVPAVLSSPPDADYEECIEKDPNRERLVPREVKSDNESPAKARSEPAPSIAVPHSTPVDKKSRMKISTALERCIADNEKEKAWAPSTVAQAKTAFTLFTHACGGDIFIEDISEKDVVAFEELCDRLPNRWGRTSDEKVGGILASLERANTLPPDHLGISAATRNKHITWITTVLNFAGLTTEGNHVPSRQIEVQRAFTELRSKSRRFIKSETKKRKREGRDQWTRNEIDRLLSAPIWSGCLDLNNRFEPGDEIYHDSWYWSPLLIILHGSRSSEISGLPLNDVHEESQIPHFTIKYSDKRSLKTIQSIRSLPIHPELIRLGFIDYVKSIRSLGHTMLFPDLDSPNSKSFASTFYKSIFSEWRTWAFPNGTEGLRIIKGVKTDKDVHSFRHAATNFMKGKVQDSVRRDILGHEGANTTEIFYDKEAELTLKLEALELLSPLTEKLDYKPLRLRPLHLQKFGKPRGRRPKPK